MRTPATTFVAGLAVWWFRPQLGSLVASIAQRGFRVSPTGVELPPQVEQQEQVKARGEALEQGQVTPADVVHKGDLFEPIAPHHSHPVLLERARLLRSEFDQLVRSQASSAEREQKLFGVFADFWEALQFERVYRLIFGTQIRFLAFLKILDDYKAPLSTARLYYEEGVKLEPQAYAGFRFEAWLGFLKEARLISVTPDDVTLTAEGDLFLGYLQFCNISTIKLG